MRRCVIVGLVLFLLLSFVSPLKAQEYFTSDINTTYTVEDSGITKIKNDITIQNLVSDVYAISIGLDLDGVKPINPKALDDKNIPLSIDTQEKNGQYELKITFPDPVVGIGNKRNFTVTYDDKQLAVKTGEVWEISAPKISPKAAINSYNLILRIPISFGDEAYISPTPSSKEIIDNLRVYTFSKDALMQSGVSAAFGKFQVFNFDLTYHLENPLREKAQVEIAIPPDTSYQKVIYDDLIPKPDNILVDADGNWLAKYYLEPRQRVDIKATGYVQMFSQAKSKNPLSTEEKQIYTRRTDYWQTDDPKIKELAQQLKTPRAIYDYVTTVLKYNYDRVKPNVERLGATRALQSPNDAICMEYTDLFIALSRAAGIPAREVNGYAYTENPDIEPLSLVSDVLHSWPEYYDEKQQLWIPVDPTWGSTTGGVDFFNKLDLRHFAFVVHGVDPLKPYPPGSYKLGANPQKDIFVHFASLPDVRVSVPQVVITVAKPLPFTRVSGKVEILNPGKVAIYNENLNVSFDNNPIIKNKTLLIIPPYSKYDYDLEIPYGILGSKLPEEIHVNLNKADATAPVEKRKIIITNISIVALLICLGLIIVINKKLLKR